MRTIARIIFWVLAFIGALVTAGVLAAILFTVGVKDKAPELPETAVLRLDLDRDLPEKRRIHPFLDNVHAAPTVFELVRALEFAAREPAVKGVVATMGSHPLGMARAQEIAAAIERFRASGKFAIVYADDLSALGDSAIEYALASAFEEVWLNPTGGVGLTGVRFEIPYFHGTLEELEVAAEFEQRHEYKGGADPFLRAGMALPVRRSLQGVADGWVAQIARRVAHGRGLDAAAARDLIDEGPFLARDALTEGLVDRLGYYDQMEDALDDRLGSDDWDAIGAAHLIAAAGNGDVAAATIALVQGQGAILPDAGGGLLDEEGFGPYAIAEALEDALDDALIKAVLLRVDSPGGAYGPSNEVWRAVTRLREAGKPVVVSMGDMAASGGYFVAAGADRIVAHPGTLTGSIGVYAGKFATEGLWDKLGVTWSTVAAGRNAGMWSGVTKFTPSQRRKFRESVDFVYDDFTSKVSVGRGLTGQALDDAARGRILTGVDALAVGLVDELGGYPEALDAVRGLLNLEDGTPLDIVILPEPLSPWDRIAEWLEEGGSVDDLISALVAPAIDGAVRRRIETVTGDLGPLLGTRQELMMPPFRVGR